MRLRQYFGSRYYYYPKKMAHKALYKINHEGKELNWDNPTTLDEKIHILTASYGKKEAYYADKIQVREYVKKCGFEDMLPEVYGVWKNTEEIDLKKLPKKFVLKTNHASGGDYLVICKSKNSIDWSEKLKKIQECMKINFAKSYCEYHYKYIVPRIFAEELLDDGIEDRMIDYKIHCFNGEPYCIQLISNRASGNIEHNIYDFEWNELDFVTEGMRSDRNWKKPDSLSKMYEAAKKLSEPFQYARIDFYDVYGKAYFGEITLSPAGGNLNYLNDKAQRKLGEMIQL